MEQELINQCTSVAQKWANDSVFDADTQVKPHYLKTVVQYLNGGIDGVQSRVKMFNKNENFLARMQHVEFASFGNTLIAKDNLGSTGFLGGNGCGGCSDGCGDNSCIWIILLLLFCGNGSGFGIGGGCGCNGNCGCSTTWTNGCGNTCGDSCGC